MQSLPCDRIAWSAFSFDGKLNALRLFAWSHFRTENRFPPRLKSGAGFFLKMLSRGARNQSDSRARRSPESMCRGMAMRSAISINR